MGGACSIYGGEETCIQGVVRKPEGNRTFKTRSSWEANINMDLQEVGCGDRDWIDLAQDRDRWRALENAVM
jgi:hypothetical protein